MGEFGQSYSAEQMPPTAPVFAPNSAPHPFGDCVLPSRNTKPTLLQGGVTEFGAAAQLQNGITDNTSGAKVPLEGNIQGGQLRAGVNDSSGGPTYCLRIEDKRKDFDRPVFGNVLTGRVYHNVFIKETDKAIVERAKIQGTLEEINLYDNTGHVIARVYAAAVGGLFTVNYEQSTVVLNIYDSPSINNGRSTAIPQGLKQTYKKCKPALERLLNQLR